jgi:hypothetical protein
MNHPMQLGHPLRKNLLVLPPGHSIHPRRRVSLKAIKAIHELLRRDVMQARREPQPPIPARCLTYAFQVHRRTTDPA